MVTIKHNKIRFESDDGTYIEFNSNGMQGTRVESVLLTTCEIEFLIECLIKNDCESIIGERIHKKLLKAIGNSML